MPPDAAGHDTQPSARSEDDVPATSRLAVASALLGSVGWLPGGGVAAAIFGVRAMNQIAKPANPLKGHGSWEIRHLLPHN